MGRSRLQGRLASETEEQPCKDTRPTNIDRSGPFGQPPKAPCVDPSLHNNTYSPCPSVPPLANSQKERGKRLTNILVAQLVGQSHPLRLMLDRFAVDNGCLELLHNSPMNSVALQVWMSQSRVFLLVARQDGNLQNPQRYFSTPSTLPVTSSPVAFPWA
jgi:hypothetical protein